MSARTTAPGAFIHFPQRHCRGQRYRQRPVYSKAKLAANSDGMFCHRLDGVLVIQVNIDAPVALSFLFDLTDAYFADFRSRSDVRAAARLQVDSFDLE